MDEECGETQRQNLTGEGKAARFSTMKKKFPLKRKMREWEKELLSRGDLYLVGGTVRDLLLGLETDSVDEDFVVTGLSLEDVSKILASYGSIDLVGKSFGVIKFTPSGERAKDISLPRTEFSTGPAHRDFDVRFDPFLPIERDLERRDFTINSMAVHIGTLELIDPLGGQRDLEKRLLRVNRENSFCEDALRILRGIQIAVRFDLAIEQRTRELMRRDKDLIASVSVERVREELTKLMLLAEKPSRGFMIMHEDSLLQALLPELEITYGEIQNEYHPDDVFTHSLRSCDYAPKDLVLRWSALFHDVGKVQCRMVVAGRTVFYRHEEASAVAAGAALERLRYSNEVIARVVHLVRNHMFYITEEWTDSALRRFIARVGKENLENLLSLRLADALSRGDDSVERENERIKERIESILRSEAALKVKDLKVNGQDVMEELGIEQGPLVGEILEKLLDLVLENPEANTRERLLCELRSMRKK